MWCSIGTICSKTVQLSQTIASLACLTGSAHAFFAQFLAGIVRKCKCKRKHRVTIKGSAQIAGKWRARSKVSQAFPPQLCAELGNHWTAIQFHIETLVPWQTIVG